MFNSSSAAKRERQNVTRRLRNRETKSEVRTSVKKFQAAVESKDKTVAEETLVHAIKLLDTAGSKGTLHRNTVSRKKSRLYAQYNALNKAE